MPYRSIYRDGLFDGQVIVVTGGGSGIGRCIAHELASLGATVALVGRRIERLEAVQAEIEEDGGKALAHACDLRDEESVRGMVADIVERAGRIDGLVNNAGGQFTAPAETMNQKGFETVVRNNLVSGFLAAKECYLQWMQDHGGAIVNIVADPTSGMPAMVHAGAARAGMMTVTETLAVEWAPAGVRVNAVAPGYIASSGMDTYSPEMQQKFRENTRKMPMKRMGTESEVSSVVCFLLSEGASYVSGSTYFAHGAALSIRQDWTVPDHDRARPYQGFHRYAAPKMLTGED